MQNFFRYNKTFFISKLCFYEKSFLTLLFRDLISVLGITVCCSSS